MPEPKRDRLIGVAEAGRILNLHPRSVRRQVEEGKIPESAVIDINGKWFFRLSTIEAAAKSRGRVRRET